MYTKTVKMFILNNMFIKINTRAGEATFSVKPHNFTTFDERLKYG